MLMLNAIAWTAKLEIPEGGVESSSLERYQITEAVSHGNKGGIPGGAPLRAGSAP